MKALDFPLLADENIDPDVIAMLKTRGHDVLVAREQTGGASTDREVLRVAHQSWGVVLTHDADFGALAIRDGEPFIGIVHLRPGHIRSADVIAMLDAVADIDVEPFVLVASRRGSDLRVRVRAGE